jgi:hypothetical protein
MSMSKQMHNRRRSPSLLTAQRGVYAVEFAIAAMVFFTVLFMVIEFSRLLFSWNLMEEITRRGARLAAVCPVTAPQDIRAGAMLPGVSLPNFTTDNIAIEYLTNVGAAVSNPVDGFGTIYFVRASIVNYQYEAFFPLNILFNAPGFVITLPAESLGITPPGTGVVTCQSS